MGAWSFPHAVETCAAETSETYTVSYTTALLVIALIAKEMGADSNAFTSDDLFGPSSGGRWTVILDLFESYLEAA